MMVSRCTNCAYGTHVIAGLTRGLTENRYYQVFQYSVVPSRVDFYQVHIKPGIRIGISAPMADRPYLTSAVRPNELRNV